MLSLHWANIKASLGALAASCTTLIETANAHVVTVNTKLAALLPVVEEIGGVASLVAPELAAPIAAGLAGAKVATNALTTLENTLDAGSTVVKDGANAVTSAGDALKTATDLTQGKDDTESPPAELNIVQTIEDVKSTVVQGEDLVNEVKIAATAIKAGADSLTAIEK